MRLDKTAFDVDKEQGRADSGRAEKLLCERDARAKLQAAEKMADGDDVGKFCESVGGARSALAAMGDAPDELQRQANPPVRLVIFGDSWARDDQMKTWPELLAQNLGWAAVNVALPGSDSNTLPLQLRLLETVLERSNRRLHPDAWAPSSSE